MTLHGSPIVRYQSKWSKDPEWCIEPFLGYRYQSWYNVQEWPQVKLSYLLIVHIKLDSSSWLQKRMNYDWSNLGVVRACYHPKRLLLFLHSNIHHCHNPSWSNLEVIWEIRKYRLVDSCLRILLILKQVHKSTKQNYYDQRNKMWFGLTEAISAAISSPFSNFCSSWMIFVKPSMKILTKSISDLPSLFKVHCHIIKINVHVVPNWYIVIIVTMIYYRRKLSGYLYGKVVCSF